MHVKLPYGMIQGNEVTIDEVENGLKCDCDCPACSSKLIARKGTEKVHHFAHHNSADCDGALETVVHKLCKEFIAEAKKITIPPVSVDLYGRYTIFPEKELEIEEISLEKKFGLIIPDIIIQHKGRKILIEIAVNHFADRNKLYFLRQEDIPAIEINAKNMIADLYHRHDYKLTDAAFRKEIISGINRKYWLHNPRRSRLISALKDKHSHYKEMKTDSYGYRFAENCPLGKRTWHSGKQAGQSYARYEDCYKCSLCLWDHSSYSEVYCLGHLRDNFSRILEEMKHKT